MPSISVSLFAGHSLLTPIEYQALDAVFTAYNNKEIMDAWQSLCHLRVVTLHIITRLLECNKLIVDIRDLRRNLDKGIKLSMEVCQWLFYGLYIMRTVLLRVRVHFYSSILFVVYLQESCMLVHLTQLDW